MSRALTLATLLTLSAPALAHEGSWFQLQLDEGKPTSASLTSAGPGDVPRIMHEVMLGDLQIAMLDNLTRFERAVRVDGLDPSGGGDGSGGLALIAGILGFIPGFGLGHLITGNMGGFLLFLVIDLVIAGVFFVLFPVLAFTLWYVPSLIVILVERVVEAFSAANSATSSHFAETVPAGEPFDHLPAANASFSIFNF